MTRIVLDTNCLVAALPTKSRYHKLWTDFLEGRIILCVSTEVLLEYEEILTRKASPLLAESVIKTMLNKPNVVRVVPAWRFGMIEADPDDNKFVDCAIVCSADFIVSDDTHFDVLRDIPFPKVRVRKLDDFLQDFI